MSNYIEQERKMRWILFLVFVCLFIVIVLGTLAAIFLDFGNLKENERNLLFNLFLLEIGVAVVALFYSIFKLRRPGEFLERKVRINHDDVMLFIGKTAKLFPKKKDSSSLDEITTIVLDDNGPYLPIDLPPSTYYVRLTIEADGKNYAGSFVVGSYFVDIRKEGE